MSVDKLVDSTQLDADLTSVANAIRAKSGGSGSLAFPAGFVSEIGNISGGGGYSADEIATTSGITGELVLSSTSVRKGAFAGCTGITKITAPNVTTVYSFAFYGCTGVTSCDFSSLKTIRYRALNRFGTQGMSLFLPEVTTTSGASEFDGLSGGSAVPFSSIYCSYLILPKLSGTSPTYLASGASNLIGADFGVLSGFGGNSFNGCTNLTVLILRHSSVVSLSGTNVFTNTPFASGKAGGTIYIPKVLYDNLGTGTNDYKAATNWSTIDGYGTITWAQIEGSQYENYYADGTAISS